MPISLIRNSKDNAMHGTDNGKYTGCRMKVSAANFSREGELRDITDLTCERCKEVFATKMIRESNKEELRIAKEEKKRYQRAKKQGIVREATYEEYLMNREAEASAKRDSRNDEATSSSLQKLRDAIPTEQVQPGQPVFTPYGGSSQNSVSQPVVSAPQAPFDPYAHSAAPQPVVSAPQNIFDPYAQSNASQPAVTAPQNMFDPYAQSSAPQQTVTAPQNMFDPYAQTPAASVPQSMFDPYANQTPPVSAPQAAFDPYAQTPAASVPQSMFDPYANQTPPVSAPQAAFDPYSSASVQNHSFQFDEIPAQPEEKKAEEPSPVFQEYTGAASLSQQLSSVQQAAKDTAPEKEEDDFLSQFLVKPQPAPEPQASAPAPAQTTVSAPVSSAAKADASSFFSDSIPVIGAEYAGASSVNSAVTEFGSLNIAETPNDEFVVPNVPVYQPSGNNYVSQNLNNFSTAQTSAFMDELASPGVPASAPSPVSSMAPVSADYNHTESIMDGFDSLQYSAASNPAPAQPATASLTGFETVAPMQSAAPSMSSFNSAPAQTVYPQNPYAAPSQPSGFQMPQGYGTPAPAPAPAPVPKPQPRPASSPVFAAHGNTADSIEEALRQLGAEVGNSGNGNNNQMPEKEELVPDFVAYVPSSSKVLHQSAPSSSASSSVPKRPVSAREAKQLAKIDAKFKKDLISRGFNPTEIKYGRRGK